ncbi:membrane protein [Marivirga lumbricoides]|uniref:Membrane protein n=1 Tax=Marivirga lumbricoides TaxID=1046115 RepID=A0ABQ1LL33_9BACT|nr:membrane protein [Marivirga lumbricoides]
MLKFNKYYFLLTVILFITEVLIALYVHDNFVRPYLGDVLVVILIYTFIKSFLDLAVLPVALFVLALSFTIEMLQFFKIVELLGLGDSRIARIVIGTSFAWIDLVAYTAGIVILLLVEKYGLGKKLSFTTANAPV